MYTFQENAELFYSLKFMNLQNQNPALVSLT